MKHLLFISAILLLFATITRSQQVVSINVDGTINPASASFIRKAITKAEKENAECVIVHLNTPGGLLKSTRQIVSTILESDVPVIVYVFPGGAHAGSAGVFITMSAHVAAMAPGTNIGAAHPVSMQGEMDTIMSDKSTNDAAAFIRAIAEKRKRNIEWGEEAVRKSVSITETEAKAKNVIDVVARNDDELLDLIDGKVVQMDAGDKTLRTRGANVENLEMSVIEKFLDMLSDPNIAYILMMLGFYGLLFELYSPGAIFPGVLGGICLILGFYAMHTLPINYAGLALIIFGIVLLLLEIKVTSYGILAIGGIISLLLGSIFLLDVDSALEFIEISWTLIIATTAVSAIFFLFLGWMGLYAQRLKPVSGMEGMVGLTGTTLTTLDPEGMIKVHGEIWNAEAQTGTIEKDSKIRVRRISGLKLFVEPLDENGHITNTKLI
jgi:membrane-bound serine protease (ClpP class)